MAAKFKSRMRERARERANARRNQATGGTTLQMPEGMSVDFFKVTKTTHHLDIIPYVVSDKNHPDAKPGELWHSRRYFIHRSIGAEENSYICPARTYGDPCPICEYAKQRKNEGAEQEELNELRPKERQLFNVIDLNDDSNKIMLWDISYHLFGKQLDKELIEGDEEYGGFSELEDGYTLKVRFEKKSFNKTDFFEADRIDFKKRKEDYDEEIIDETIPLDDVLKVLSYKELEKIFIMGTADTNNDDEDEEEDEKPRKKRQSGRDAEEEEEEEAPKKRRRKSAPVEEESEDEDEEEEKPKRRRSSKQDQTEEEEAPKRKRRKKDPVEEEEEEEEKPKRRRRNLPEPEEEEEAESDDEQEEEEEEEKPKRRSSKSNEDSGSAKCPYGHKFGKQTDDYDDCDACKKWAACNAAKSGK